MGINLALRISRIVPSIGKMLPVIRNSQSSEKGQGLLVCAPLEESAFLRMTLWFKFWSGSKALESLLVWASGHWIWDWDLLLVQGTSLG